MKTFEPKKGYRDNLATRRRRRFIARGTLVILLVLAGIVASGYAIFYSPWFTIKNLSISGLDSEHASLVNAMVTGRLDNKFLGLPTGRNIIFFKAKSLSGQMLEQFSFLDDISIAKTDTHSLSVTGVERKPEGVWCFKDRCHYFDGEGVTWGNAIRSSGFLLLNVDDMREQPAGEHKVDKKFFDAIRQVAERFEKEGIKIKNVTIPREAFTEFQTLINDGYVIRFSLDSDVAGQLDAMFIFKKNKLDSGQVHHQYLDLRFDGRVYYK